MEYLEQVNPQEQRIWEVLGARRGKEFSDGFMSIGFYDDENILKLGRDDSCSTL